MPDEIDLATEVHSLLEAKQLARSTRFNDNPTPGICQRCDGNINEERVQFFKNFKDLDIDTCGRPECEDPGPDLDPKPREDAPHESSCSTSARAAALTSLVDYEEPDADE